MWIQCRCLCVVTPAFEHRGKKLVSSYSKAPLPFLSITNIFVRVLTEVTILKGISKSTPIASLFLKFQEVSILSSFSQLWNMEANFTFCLLMVLKKTLCSKMFAVIDQTGRTVHNGHVLCIEFRNLGIPKEIRTVLSAASPNPTLCNIVSAKCICSYCWITTIAVSQGTKFAVQTELRSKIF